MHLIYMIHIARDAHDRHGAKNTVGYVFEANFGHMHLLYMIHIAHDTYDIREKQKTHESWSHF